MTREEDASEGQSELTEVTQQIATNSVFFMVIMSYIKRLIVKAKALFLVTIMNTITLISPCRKDLISCHQDHIHTNFGHSVEN